MDPVTIDLTPLVDLLTIANSIMSYMSGTVVAGCALLGWRV